EVEQGKIAKADRKRLSVELVRTTDVLSEVTAMRRPNQLVIGFAAEHGERAVELARGKLEQKRLDAIVVNDISRDEVGFESEDNEVTIVTRSGDTPISKRSKHEVAAQLLDRVQELRE